MAGTIEIKFDLPEFKEVLNVSIVIKKDGKEVTATTSSSSDLIIESDKEIKQEVSKTKKAKKKEVAEVAANPIIEELTTSVKEPSVPVSGNFMNIEF